MTIPCYYKMINVTLLLLMWLGLAVPLPQVWWNIFTFSINFPIGFWGLFHDYTQSVRNECETLSCNSFCSFGRRRVGLFSWLGHSSEIASRLIRTLSKTLDNNALFRQGWARSTSDEIYRRSAIKMLQQERMNANTRSLINTHVYKDGMNS